MKPFTVLVILGEPCVGERLRYYLETGKVAKSSLLEAQVPLKGSKTRRDAGPTSEQVKLRGEELPGLAAVFVLGAKFGVQFQPADSRY